MFKQARTTWNNSNKPEKLWNIYVYIYINIFQTLNVRQHRTMVPERRETNEKELDRCPDLLLGETFQPQYKKGAPRWSTLNWGGSFVSLESPRHLELAEQSPVEMVLQRKSSPNQQKFLLESSTQYYSVRVNEETTQNQRKKHLKTAGGTIPEVYAGPEMFPLARVKHLKILRTSCRTLRRSLPQ